MARAQGARALMALGFETIYGTPPAVNKFWKMPFASSSLGSEQPLLASELLGYGRDPLAPIADAITDEGDVVVPIDPRFWGIWLKAAFGAPVTVNNTGVYTHTFKSGGWSLPSFSAEIGMPEVPYYAMNSGCVVNQLAWEMRRTGLVTASAGIIGQGETTGALTAVGTPVALSVSRFGAFQGSMKRDGATLANIVSGQITYANNLDRIETIRNDGRIEGVDPSIATLSGTLVARFADQTLLAQAIAGTAIELQFLYSASASLSFTLIAHAVYLPRPKITIDGPGGVQATFAWQAAFDPVAGQMCTAVLINDQPLYTL